MTRVLVTGATGWLGGHILTAVAAAPGLTPIAACRDPQRLPLDGCEIRVGDLTDAGYRRDVVDGVDVICHAGTWAAFWGHRAKEQTLFYEPLLGLLEEAERGGVARFVLASTVAAGASGPISTIAERDRPARANRFWPHLELLMDAEQQMRRRASARTSMVSLRLGHFVGPGNAIGIVPALVPRLRTRIVPWLAGGTARLPMVTGEDLGRAFALAAGAELSDPYDVFAVCGPEFPTAREVLTLIAGELGVPAPWFSVPFAAANLLASACEATKPVVPGPAPFLTRSAVHLLRDWYCPDERAGRLLDYVPVGDWRAATRAAVASLAATGGGWPNLRQA